MSASNYPAGFDALSDPTGSDPLDSLTVPHADQHADVNSAVEAIQATLGLNPQGVFGTVRSRLESIGFNGTTSTTSLAIGTGSKAFSVNNVGWYAEGTRVRVVDLANPTTKWVEGEISDIAGTTITVAVDLTAGSGTVASWVFTVAGEQGETGPAGIIASATPPADTSVLWADTSVDGVGHAATHAAAGSDPLTLSVAQVTGAAPAASPTFTGVLTIPAGSAAAPSIVPSGDTSTGIYSPAADSLAIATAGTERLNIDSAGLFTGTGTSMGAWTAYTPSLAASTGWAIGNGSVAGIYVQIGKLVHFRILIQFGSTSTYGSLLKISQPVSGRAWANISSEAFKGFAADASTGKVYELYGQGGTTDLTMYVIIASTGEQGLVASTVPFTWASSDFIRLSGTYEAA